MKMSGQESVSVSVNKIKSCVSECVCCGLCCGVLWGVVVVRVVVLLVGGGRWATRRVSIHVTSVQSHCALVLHQFRSEQTVLLNDFTVMASTGSGAGATSESNVHLLVSTLSMSDM